ncbi:MAG: hypothetical protein M1607_04125 [Patescibacteria group bacterium]|nr:hypothetical protein [Patescibacteria group bacterium]
MSDINQEKITIWKQKLAKLEEEYKDIMLKRGEAMAMGDLRENAAFQMLDEDAATWRVKIGEVKKIIAKLENGQTH